MTWTNEQRQELSRQVAEKFSVTAYTEMDADAEYVYGCRQKGWIHDDRHTIMNLCVKHGVRASHTTGELGFVECFRGNNMKSKTFYADHNNDPSLAERIARMMALMEINLETTK